MKTLLIGMDGAQLATFKRGWTPFIKSLIENGNQLTLKEDLISRGWAEIFTGKHGVDTGALYDRPNLGGTLDWSLNFKIEEIPGLGVDIKPIWQQLNEHGYRVGIMNVPTTFPAPEVNGFFVSGGGGGSQVVHRPTKNLCYPKEILDTLLDTGYIVDERIGSLIGEKKIYDPIKIFSRLEEKNQKRTESFINLSNTYNIDFGFLVFKSSSVMAELFLIPEIKRHLSNKKNIDHQLLDSIKHYYQTFDKQIKWLVEAFPNTEIILVSDHSITETKYMINLNSFLQDSGFQSPSQTGSKVGGFVHQIKKYLKPLIPFHIRNYLRQKTTILTLDENKIIFDSKNTEAFCMPMGDWTTGIYINDKKRFHGIVESEDVLSLSKKISSALNKHPLSIQHGLNSSIKPVSKSPAAPYFPDIIVNCPNGYIVSNYSSDFFSKFKISDQPINIKTWTNQYKPYCIKGHYPIASSNRVWKIKATDQKNDLRLIYDHVLATFLGKQA